MPTFVVLLRGVNVGKAKRVPMAQFKELLIDIGCSTVSTLLNSGNAVVKATRQSPAALARKVASALEDHFGFPVPVVIKSADELNLIVAGTDLVDCDTDHSRFLVAFAQEPSALTALKPIAELVTSPERFAIGPHAAYLHCPHGILESKSAKALGKMGEAFTTRNWATVLKLQTLVANNAG
jgi:uncharacterized protein (DUF1697 family)